MELYIIIIEDIYEFDSYKSDPAVRLTRKEAREKLDELYRSGRECYKGQYDKFEKKKDSFSMYPDGYYGTSHYDGRIVVVDVPGLPGSDKDSFVISSLSRADLRRIGFDASKKTVSDKTMERLASKLGDDYVENRFWDSLDTFAALFGIPRKTKNKKK